jgi:hypothetical protein
MRPTPLTWDLRFLRHTSQEKPALRKTSLFATPLERAVICSATQEVAP